jgi:methylated-DNA-protein-cysteine methyltransferase-like protein
MKYLSLPDQAVFRKQVWEIVRQIPPGKVFTYGQIAARIPLPGGMTSQDYTAWGSRWVGGAMAACPDDIPWQRVINSKGKISLRPGSGAVRQRQMLEEEGVIFDDRERVDLKKFAWAGPSLEWLQAHGLVSPGGS